MLNWIHVASLWQSVGQGQGCLMPDTYSSSWLCSGLLQGHSWDHQQSWKPLCANVFVKENTLYRQRKKGKNETVKNIRRSTKLRGWKGCSSGWNEDPPTKDPYLSPHWSRYFPRCTITQRDLMLVCGNCVKERSNREKMLCLDPDHLHLLLPRRSYWI